jgi:hypothetical protein
MKDMCKVIRHCTGKSFIQQHFYYLENGEIRFIDRDTYTSWYKPEEVDPSLEWETEFYSIDITEHLASVKLRLECQKNRYIDYFNMMKEDGKWWIVNKMSYPINKENE